MITAVPKEQAILTQDLKKDYNGIYRKKLVGFPGKVAESLVQDSIILDEIEKDIDNLDGVKIRRLLKMRIKN